MTKIYLVEPLFSQADSYYNAYLVERIRQLDKIIDLHLPQEDAAINGKSAYVDSKIAALVNIENVPASDLSVTLLDGPTTDTGVASGVGVAYAKGIPVVILYTDSRQQGANNHQKLDASNEIAENQFHYLNPYTVGLIKLNSRVVSSEESLLGEIEQRLP